MKYTKKTCLQAFKLMMTAKKKREGEVPKSEKFGLWNVFIVDLANKGMINTSVAKKWKNPYT